MGINTLRDRIAVEVDGDTERLEYFRNNNINPVIDIEWYKRNDVKPTKMEMEWMKHLITRVRQRMIPPRSEQSKKDYSIEELVEKYSNNIKNNSVLHDMVNKP